MHLHINFTNMLPLNLPDRTPTYVIIFLAIGFPIAIILLWIFDITLKRIGKPRPLVESQEGERQLRTGDIQSFIVLCFDNFTSDGELEYFILGKLIKYPFLHHYQSHSCSDHSCFFPSGLSDK